MRPSTLCPEVLQGPKESRCRLLRHGCSYVGKGVFLCQELPKQGLPCCDMLKEAIACHIAGYHAVLCQWKQLLAESGVLCYLKGLSAIPWGLHMS